MLIPTIFLENKSILLKDRMADTDAHEVQRLHAAGAVILGKTCCSGFGLSAHPETRIYPQCKNPHLGSASPGGAEGGAAACVASGLSPCSIEWMGWDLPVCQAAFVGRFH